MSYIFIFPVMNFYVKIGLRENMKHLTRFLLFAIALVATDANCAPVPTTLGSNLTAYNGASGATNNNNWNNLMNSRTVGANSPTADFGNCNAIILRCAQPKCATGGCTSMDVARPIVSGCVQSNENCKQYGNDLIEYISAQLVANSTAKANAQAAAAQTAAAQAAAQQNAQQLQAMQAQMQQMQSEMAAQNAETVAQLQNALEEQKQLTAQAIADANNAQAAQTATPASSVVGGLTGTQTAAAQAGISADLLAREQISGQILSSIENAETQLKALKATMNTAFEYAGCDSRGNNCTGPKRVKAFKTRAMEFFDPYESVLDEIYDALVLAQSVGVDITDIYMLLNNSCNQWGQYLCSSPLESYQQGDQTLYRWPRYDKNTCPNNTTSVAGTILDDYGNTAGSVRGGHACMIGQTVPPEDDASCTMINAIKSTDDEGVRRNYLYASQGDYGDNVRVGCASSALDSSPLFRNRKKQAKIDIEILQRIIDQDSYPVSVRRNKNKLDKEEVKYCALTESTYANLQKYVSLKTLPTKELCINERQLNKTMDRVLLADSSSIMEIARQTCTNTKGNNAVFSEITYGCYCVDSDGKDAAKDKCNADKSEEAKNAAEQRVCESFGAKWNNGECNCSEAAYDEDVRDCAYKFDMDVPVASANKTKNNDIDEDHAKCFSTGGTYGGKSGTIFWCRCGQNTYDPNTHRCDKDDDGKGKVVKQ